MSNATQWPGPFGKGPYGPDWTDKEKTTLMPLAQQVVKAYQDLIWLESPASVSQRLEASMAKGIGCWDLLEPLLEQRQAALDALKAERERLRPDRFKRDGSPYIQPHMRSTQPGYVDSIDRFIKKEQESAIAVTQMESKS